MSLRPPSSPSPSPGPHDNSRNANSRQSLGPSTRGAGLNIAPGSPRPGARPTSELVVPGSAMYQTPEAEALDQWFENLQSYEATLEEMAAASLDVNFKEELSAIEQWFKVLSEAERTAALYSLLQHSTQVQIRFFITVLQQMARSDPMTALLSPAMGGSMQSQMENKLASLKSPGMGLPGSPTTRNFGGAGNRSSLVLDNNINYLSPDSAAIGGGPPPSAKEDPAATLAQQRAKFKASNAAHRISAPVLSSGADARNAWGNQLSQVAESNGNTASSNNTGSSDGTNSRPKSTEFTGSNARPTAASTNSGEGQTITAENSWASMVNTPLIPMFQQKEGRVSHLDAQNKKMGDWRDKASTQQAIPGPPGVPRMGDPTIHRRKAPNHQDNNNGGSVYDENGNMVRGGGAFGNRNNNNQGGGAGWGPAGVRSPALGGNNNRFGPGSLSDDGRGPPNMGMGMGMPNMGMGSPNALAGMMGMNMNNMTSPFGVNMNMLSAMGLSPEAQLLAAQMAAAQAGWLGMNQPGSAGVRGAPGLGRPPHSGRSPGGFKSPGSIASSSVAGGSTPKDAEDVDPNVLTDIPTWLRTLRLHKYTPNFEGMKWQDMVVMDEEALEKKGVAALGARRKMLKTFELVRKKMGIEGGPPSLPPSATIMSA